MLEEVERSVEGRVEGENLWRKGDAIVGGSQWDVLRRVRRAHDDDASVVLLCSCIRQVGYCITSSSRGVMFGCNKLVNFAALVPVTTSHRRHGAASLAKLSFFLLLLLLLLLLPYDAR